MFAFSVVNDEAVGRWIVDPFATWKLATMANPLNDSRAFKVVQDLKCLRARIA
jgi:hypothetical protein